MLCTGSGGASGRHGDKEQNPIALELGEYSKHSGPNVTVIDMRSFFVCESLYEGLNLGSYSQG